MVSIASHIERMPFGTVVWAGRAHLLEAALYVGAYSVYLLTRGLAFSDQTGSVARANSLRIISLEQSLGIFWEPNWQAWTIANAQPLVVFLNWAYVVTYFPVILALALALYVVKRRRYYYYRNVILINVILALLIFLLVPVAPPFKIPAYFVDTIQTFGPLFYGSPAMASFYNTNAAMPSLHVSWTIILGVLLLQTLKGWFKLAGLGYPLLTFFAITITGNHYILDAVAGAGLAAVSFAVMELGFMRRLFLPCLRPGTGAGSRGDNR